MAPTHGEQVSVGKQSITPFVMHRLPAHKAADGTNEWHLTARRHINETLATRMPSRAWAATQGAAPMTVTTKES